MDSLDALKAADDILIHVASEVNNVQLLLCKSGAVWVVSDKSKIVPRLTQLGGYGTGQYVKDSETAEGVPYRFPLKDKTVVQVDESTLRDNCSSSSVATMSFFKLLILTERERGVTSHQVSYLSVQRQGDDVLEAGMDGFSITPTQQMKFKCISDARNEQKNKVTCKNFFAKCIGAVESSSLVGPAFRFRFERVGLSLKAQKPYVLCLSALQLDSGKPLKIG